jgi:hypothetical protein
VALMVIPYTRDVGLAAATALTLVLTAGVAAAVWRGSDASCQCFGKGSRLGRRHLYRNVFLLFLCGAAPAFAGHSGGGPGILFTGAVVGVALAGIVVRWEDVGWALAPLVTSPPLAEREAP